MIDRRATLEHTPITRRLNMANLCVAANRDLALKVRKIEEDIFRQALPLKLLHLAARIQPFGSANVKSNGDSVSVEFKFYQDESLDITLGLETDPWGVQMVENSIVEFEALAEEAKRLTALARNTWDSLTQDQRTALGLQRRP